jgi:hypothetical protein
MLYSGRRDKSFQNMVARNSLTATHASSIALAITPTSALLSAVFVMADFFSLGMKNAPTGRLEHSFRLQFRYKKYPAYQTKHHYTYEHNGSEGAGSKSTWCGVSLVVGVGHCLLLRLAGASATTIEVFQLLCYATVNIFHTHPNGPVMGQLTYVPTLWLKTE